MIFTIELKSKYFRVSKESETWFTYNCSPEARRFPFQWWADFPMKEQKAVFCSASYTHGDTHLLSSLSFLFNH